MGSHTCSLLEEGAQCDVLLASLVRGLGSWVGILGWALVKRSRRFLWQVVSPCLGEWVCGGGERWLAVWLAGEWREGPVWSSLGAAEGLAEGSRSVS